RFIIRQTCRVPLLPCPGTVKGESSILSVRGSCRDCASPPKLGDEKRFSLALMWHAVSRENLRVSPRQDAHAVIESDDALSTPFYGPTCPNSPGSNSVKGAP